VVTLLYAGLFHKVAGVRSTPRLCYRAQEGTGGDLSRLGLGSYSINNLQVRAALSFALFSFSKYQFFPDWEETLL
jgi:hypothetical protein